VKTTLFNFKNGVYSAPGPAISTIPSWKHTILHVVTTAAPFNTLVHTLPTDSTLDTTPRNIPLDPSTFTLGSMTSSTGIILTLSPRLARSTSTASTCSSSFITSINSSLFTYNTPSSTLVSSPN